MKLQISKEVPYIQYSVHPVDNNGETDYGIIDEDFDFNQDETRDEYWRIEGNIYIDSIDGIVPFEQVKAYVAYLEGWFETHEENDIILFEEYKRSDEYHELFEKNNA